MDERDGPQAARHRKLMASAKEVGLTQEERIELAQYILRRDITTWSTLDDAQVLRLLDAFEGFHLIVELLAQRPPSGQ